MLADVHLYALDSIVQLVMLLLHALQLSLDLCQLNFLHATESKHAQCHTRQRRFLPPNKLCTLQGQDAPTSLHALMPEPTSFQVDCMPAMPPANLLFQLELQHLYPVPSRLQLQSPQPSSVLLHLRRHLLLLHRALGHRDTQLCQAGRVGGDGTILYSSGRAWELGGGDHVRKNHSSTSQQAQQHP